MSKNNITNTEELKWHESEASNLNEDFHKKISTEVKLKIRMEEKEIRKIKQFGFGEIAS